MDQEATSQAASKTGPSYPSTKQITLEVLEKQQRDNTYLQYRKTIYFVLKYKFGPTRYLLSSQVKRKTIYSTIKSFVKVLVKNILRIKEILKLKNTKSLDNLEKEQTLGKIVLGVKVIQTSYRISSYYLRRIYIINLLYLIL